MSLVETAKEKIRHPTISEEVVRSAQAQTAAIMRQFMVGEITLEELRKKWTNVDSLVDPVVLRYPGPLYGLLRSIGFSRADAEDYAEHERAHYRAAQANGLNPLIFLYFTIGDIKDGVQSYYAHVHVSYELACIGEQALRDAVSDVLLAPAEPSADDLAHLPIPAVKRGRTS